MAIKHIKPKAGRRVLNPATLQPLPDEGKALEYSTYWRRRFNDGDVDVEAVKTSRKSKLASKE